MSIPSEGTYLNTRVSLSLLVTSELTLSPTNLQSEMTKIQEREVIEKRFFKETEQWPFLGHRQRHSDVFH